MDDSPIKKALRLFFATVFHFNSSTEQIPNLYIHSDTFFLHFKSYFRERGRKSLRAILWTFGFGLYHVANKLLQKVNHRIKGNFFVWYTAKINFE